MNCFFHPETTAVGMCSQCGKGSCRQCIDDIGGAMLCKTCLSSAQQAAHDEYEQTVRFAREEHEQSVKSAKSHLNRAAMMGGVGALLGLVLAVAIVSSPEMRRESGALRAFWLVLWPSASYYCLWSWYWGGLTFWRWWMSFWRWLSATVGCFLIANPGTWLVLLLFFFYIPFIGGAIYGVYGGGLYQYFKHRRLARSQV